MSYHTNNKAIAKKIKLLKSEGKKPKQAVAIALSMARAGKLKKKKG
jgi:hypothetical protein